ncbi:hypothetical protein QYE76_013272 [Lolium multiflorum]|uniref:Integrase catalytic domain-containing protein n=1 Tax=Lolium multiflorum TaxID=4521 RepID=A0AAD8X5R1_LOLMU|nr:hypothetical protein QYE76_013272 [Lolium multiflorum]
MQHLPNSCGIGGKSIKVIIDGGSCHNLASTELCEKLNLKHPHPYHVQWLSDKGNVKIQHTVTVNFKIGPYEDTVECDVVPMTVCHMLLGRPWQFDKKAIHDGYSNAYTFKVKDKKEVVRLHGIPASIVSDLDAKFMSYLWKSLMAKFGVKLLFSSSSHPQTDGQTEVVNRSLSTLLRTLVKTNLKSWEDCRPHAEFAYNRAKHSTTSRSPFIIVYGFEPPTALDILPLPLHERTNMDFDKRTTAMKKLHEETRATIQEHVLRQANRLNAKKKERVFEEGDLVWIHLRKERFPQERNSKLKPRGDGPFKVLKRINNNAYVIDIPTSKYLVSNTFNISDLSPYHGDEEEQESRTTLSQGGGGDDAGWPSDTSSPRPTSPPSEPMTRARVKALHDKVNSLLTTLDLGTPLDGMLPHADVLCVIRYKEHQDPGGKANQGQGKERNNGT